MMEIEKQQQRLTASHLPFYLKCGAILLLLSLSFLVIACGASNTATTADPNGPQVTVTINFNNNLSSLGTAAPYLCGAWTNETTPGFNPGSEIAVYAHFVHNVNGNPIGVGGDLFGSPVALVAVVSKRPLEDQCPLSLSNFNGVVRAKGIDDDDRSYDAPRGSDAARQSCARIACQND